MQSGAEIHKKHASERLVFFNRVKKEGKPSHGDLTKTRIWRNVINCFKQMSEKKKGVVREVNK
jgi:hypothetical protein